MDHKWLTIPCAIATFVLAAIFGWNGKTGAMALIVVAGAVTLFFLNISKFRRFKAGTIEAEMKQAVEDAHATIEQLRNVAATSAKATLNSLMAGSFMSGSSLKNRLEIHDELISNLKSIGVSTAQIHEADEMWKRGVCIIYHRGIKHEVGRRKERNKINTDVGPEVHEAEREFQDLLNFDEWKAPSSEEMKTFIENKGLLNDRCKELLDDYQHFEKTGEIKRKEVFVEL